MHVREHKAVTPGLNALPPVTREPTRTVGVFPLPVRDLRQLGGRIRRLANLAAACHEARLIGGGNARQADAARQRTDDSGACA